MVYELYGLKEEEIAVVEGRSAPDTVEHNRKMKNLTFLRRFFSVLLSYGQSKLINQNADL